MKANVTVIALLAGTVVALPSPSKTVDERSVVKRDAPSITSAVTTLESSIATLNSTVNSFDNLGLSALASLLGVITKANAVGTSILGATKAANESSVLSPADSLTVGMSFLNLEPQIFSLLDNIVANKPKFDNVEDLLSVRKTVLGSLQLQAELSAILGTSVQSKLDPSLAGTATVINSAISSAFASAVAAYEVKSGKLELPAVPSFVIGDEVV